MGEDGAQLLGGEMAESLAAAATVDTGHLLSYPGVHMRA